MSKVYIARTSAYFKPNRSIFSLILERVVIDDFVVFFSAEVNVCSWVLESAVVLRHVGLLWRGLPWQERTFDRERISTTTLPTDFRFPVEFAQRLRLEFASIHRSSSFIATQSSPRCRRGVERCWRSVSSLDHRQEAWGRVGSLIRFHSDIVLCNQGIWWMASQAIGILSIVIAWRPSLTHPWQEPRKELTIPEFLALLLWCLF